MARKKEKLIEVIALAKGYMGRIVEPGTKFKVPENQLGSWMKRLDGGAVPAKPNGLAYTKKEKPGEEAAVFGDEPIEDEEVIEVTGKVSPAELKSMQNDVL